MDAFSTRLGIDQGRIPHAGGGHVFVLGSIQDGWTAELSVGDYARIQQEIDVTDLDFIRLQGTLRCPEDVVEEDTVWRALLIVSGVVALIADGYPGRTRVIDLTANTSKASGTQTVTIHLQLVSA